MAIAISAEARAYEETVSFHRRKSYEVQVQEDGMIGDGG